MPFLGRTGSPNGNSEEIRLFKDGKLVKVFVPAKDNDSYRWIDIVLTFDKYENQLSEVRRLNPHSLFEENLSRSDLDGKPPIAIPYYPPIKKIFTKNKLVIFIKNLRNIGKVLSLFPKIGSLPWTWSGCLKF